MNFKLLFNFATTKSSYIVAAKRTPIAGFLGKLSKPKATKLSSISIESVLNSIDLDPSCVDEVVLGNVINAGLG